MSFLHKMRGFVRVSVRGMYCNRILSECIREGIPVYSPRPLDYQEIQFTVHVTDFPLLWKPVRKNACHLHILKKGGVPLFLHAMRRRIVFFTGFFACILLSWALTGFLWSFEVVGCETLSPTYILQLLAEEGISRGTPVSAVDPPDLRNRILLKEHKLIFLTIRTEGSHAVVEVRERREAPALTDDSVPRNLVAARAGLVSSVILRQGTGVVSSGTLVEKGDLLVKGILRYRALASGSSEEYAEKPVRAEAEVFARVWTQVRLVCPVKAAIKYAEAVSRNRYSVIICGFRLNLYFSAYISDTECDIIVTRKSLRLPGGYALPITILKETVTPYTRVVPEADTQDAQDLQNAQSLQDTQDLQDTQSLQNPSDTKLLRDLLEQEAISRLEAAVGSSELTIDAVKTAVVNGAVYVTALGETVEDIACADSD